MLLHSLPAHLHLLFSHFVGLVGFCLFFAPLVKLALVNLGLQRVNLLFSLCQHEVQIEQLEEEDWEGGLRAGLPEIRDRHFVVRQE